MRDVARPTLHAIHPGRRRMRAPAPAMLSSQRIGGAADAGFDVIEPFLQPQLRRVTLKLSALAEAVFDAVEAIVETDFLDAGAGVLARREQPRCRDDRAGDDSARADGVAGV